jgi:hypothetical protein
MIFHARRQSCAKKRTYTLNKNEPQTTAEEPPAYFLPAAAPPGPPVFSGLGLNLGGGSLILRAVTDLTRTTREWMAAQRNRNQVKNTPR